jgi:hypothetical protein
MGDADRDRGGRYMPTAIVKIDPRQIPALEGKLIGRTFYEAMERFYADPNNRRRFEEWQKARKESNGKPQSTKF